VGAAIAAGSQEEKGIWALLVAAVKINKINRKDGKLESPLK
jgi:hypothetical protein